MWFGHFLINEQLAITGEPHNNAHGINDEQRAKMSNERQANTFR